ncbi:MAG: AAA family ATPase [Burkholderiaceae bacterium]|nr:AAA family ATPase [Burkholderiaceae bacterium]
MSMQTPMSKTEVIAFCSGKGGTGKTSLIAALGYALSYSGHRVLMIDADRATDGFSLFILGPEGTSQVDAFAPQSTFGGILSRYASSGSLEVEAHQVHRLGPGEHDLSYEAIISGKGLYGDENPADGPPSGDWNRQYDRPVFQAAVRAMFDQIRAWQQYDYVLVDTRGGFSFESTDVAAAADSFVIVTEATYTNFYQDRNLVDRISSAAQQMGTRSLLRGIIVNKATDPPELSFRNELVREFGVRMDDTFSVALDVEAAKVYKMQKAIFLEAPASRFAFDAMQAFQKILKVVTAQWPQERARKWNELVAKIDAAIALHNQAVEAKKLEDEARTAAHRALQAERDTLSKDIELLRAASEQERRRQDILAEELKAQAQRRDEQSIRDHQQFEARLAEERHRAVLETDRLAQRLAETERQLSIAQTQARELEQRGADLERTVVVSKYSAEVQAAQARSRSVVITTLVAVAAVVIAGAGLVKMFYLDGAKTAAPAPAPAATVEPAPLPQRSAVPEQRQELLQGSRAPSWLRPCLEGSYNVVVAGGFKDWESAQQMLGDLRRNFPTYEFALNASAGDRQSPRRFGIFAGQGLSAAEAKQLTASLSAAGLKQGGSIVRQDGSPTCLDRDVNALKTK